MRLRVRNRPADIFTICSNSSHTPNGYYAWITEQVGYGWNADIREW